MLSEDHHLRTSLQSDTAADDDDEHPDSNASGDTDGGYRQRQKKKGRRLSQWKFKVVATVESDGPNDSSTDVIGAIAFDKSNDFFATGGSARKIRVYAFQSLSKEDVFYDDDDEEEEEEEEDADQKLRRRRRLQRKIMLPMDRKPRATTHSSSSSSSRADHTSSCCMTEICTPAKLSSLKWHFERDNIIGCGDYDGVFAEWDIERHIAVSEKDEHNGQRIWSIDYSVERPSLCASASQDGTVRMWSRSSDHSVALLHAPNHSPVCGAEFAPCSSFLLALACADSNVYVNDLRKLSTPVLTLSHHKRAVSYVRFLSKDQLVSAAIDSTLKLWDVSSCVQNSPMPPPEVNHDDDESGRSHLSNILQCQQQPVKTFGYHQNARNFVGLSVWAEGGLIACGSETNEAFAYDCHKDGEPILRYDFGHNFNSVPEGLVSIAGRKQSSSSEEQKSLIDDKQQGRLMVSAVCWRQKESECTLVAANSVGVLRLIRGFF
ncbi:unnamed protein product [Sphagnum jensenii]|jgi:E3 ubiquitin-protein ligase RFWD2|uniref:Uncharacterized protein n=2 Tax=Sphagnum jensenii TaxID=128206 RepID=A0ABP0XCX9_9BRYO